MGEEFRASHVQIIEFVLLECIISCVWQKITLYITDIIKKFYFCFHINLLFFFFFFHKGFSSLSEEIAVTL